MLLVLAVACGTKEVIKEVQVPGETVVVEKEVIKEVQVPGETVTVTKEVIREVKVPGETVVVTQEVIKEIAVPGETITVVKEVIKEVRVPGETVVVTQEVIREVAVPGEVVVVTREVIKEVTAAPAPAAAAISLGTTVPFSKITGVTGRIGTGSGLPTDCVWCHTFTVIGAGEALVMAGKDVNGTYIAQPWVAESWTTASDLSYTDWTIRKGIIFHQGFGEMTAEDVVWTFNAANPAITPEAVHDTMPLPAVGRLEVVDKYTARMNWNGFAANTIIQMTDLGEGIPIHSKTAFDQKGTEWLRANIILSGPFEVTQWTVQDKIRMIARQDGQHWDHMPYLAAVDIVEVLEASTRRAMLEVNQAQMGDIPLKDWPGMIDRGFKLAPEGTSVAHGVLFQGNYWETTHPRTGEAVERNLDLTRPWIAAFDDEAGKLRARDVRIALSQCVDREAILETLLSGIGRPAYIQYIHPDAGLYAKYNGDVRWSIPFDCVGSKALLVKHGYGDGFTLNDYWAGPSGLPLEIGEAMAALWLAELNVKVEIDRQTYSTMRPTLIARTRNGMHGDFCTDSSDPTWPNEWTWSAIGAPAGWNSGNELPKASETVLAKEATTDQGEIERLTVEWLDYIHENRFGFMTGTLPNRTVYNPTAIASWEMRPMTSFRLGGMKSLDKVQPVVK